MMEMKHIAIVGERGGADHGEPVGGYTGKRLARLIGVTDEEYLEAYRVNLWEHDSTETIDQAAKRIAVELAPKLDGYLTILLGRRVAASFGLPKAPFLTAWRIVRGESTIVVALVSHTSGRSRLYNDAEYRTRTNNFLLGIISQADEWRRKPLVATKEDTMIANEETIRLVDLEEATTTPGDVVSGSDE